MPSECLSLSGKYIVQTEPDTSFLRWCHIDSNNSRFFKSFQRYFYTKKGKQGDYIIKLSAKYLKRVRQCRLLLVLALNNVAALFVTALL